MDKRQALLLVCHSPAQAKSLFGSPVPDNRPEEQRHPGLVQNQARYPHESGGQAGVSRFWQAHAIVRKGAGSVYQQTVPLL